MTLHWWMHWFWVTAQLAVILASPVPSTTEDPRFPSIGQVRQNLTLSINFEAPSSTLTPTIDPQIIERVKYEEEQPEISTRASFRVAKAIGSYVPPNKSNTAAAEAEAVETSNYASLDSDEFSNISRRPYIKENSQEVVEWSSTQSPAYERNRNVNNELRTRTSPSNMLMRQDGPNGTGGFIPGGVKRDSRITWVLTTSRTPIRRRNEETSAAEIIRNFSTSVQEEEKDLTVLPLRVEGARFKLVVNRTRTIVADGVDGITRTFNGSEDIEIDQEVAEPRLSATAASILQAGISESTRLSRARNAFTSDFQRDREEDRSSEVGSDVLVEDDSINTESESSSPSVVDIAAITGSCLATVIIISTMASFGFIMYRRRYLNPPQTLNSDKCSNPDSSGYIDDSTIRDNSEEMYSLDNDSFLNSLEAMTIQNYWTDSVKHTKL